MPTFDDAVRALDERFARIQAEARIPGVTWGVVRDGALVHTGGIGTLRDGEACPPDADSIFRIASMTKSFTATAILILRDERRLRLDDPVATYVPELAAWSGPTTDSGPVTIRQLLTMSAGLPTDDPWGDRQQALPLDEFADLLAAGPTFAWPPGVMFEYSNLGYGILGRVVTAAAGQEYAEFAQDRVLAPLGMASTAYHAENLPAERVATGYVRRGDSLVGEGADGYGALASMGGLYSTVRDLAVWVAGFLDAFPARDDPEGGHPLRRAARREMQQMHRMLPGAIAAHAAHEAPTLETAGYGFGLFMVSKADLGTRVSHGGGYPGFGSYMTWHPATGLGLIALGNLRYAPVHAAAGEELEALVWATVVPQRRLRPLPTVDAFQPVVEGLLAHWDDTVADAAFAMNMDLDEPREMRREAVEKLALDLGPFRAADDRPVTADSPAHRRWWLRGERGWIRASILVTPEPEPRLQRMDLVGVVDPSSALVDGAERLLEAGGAPGGEAWPGDVAAASTLDFGTVVRSLHAASARLGTLRLGLPSAGDGTTTVTFDVFGDAMAGQDTGEAAPAALSLTLDPVTGEVTALSLKISEREAPVEAW